MSDLIKTVTIGDRDFTIAKMNFIPAQKMFLRIVQKISPLLGAVQSSEGAEKDAPIKMDAKAIVSALQQFADESIFDDIVMPLLSQASVAVSGGKKLSSQGEINAAFTVDGMMDFWELVYEVLMHNFQGFFTQAGDRFGVRVKEFLKKGSNSPTLEKSTQT